MEINSRFVVTARPKPGISVSRCPTGFSVKVDGRVVQQERPEDACSLITHLAKLLKKPVKR